MPRGKCRALNAFNKKGESKINNIHVHFKKIEKEPLNKSKASRRQETIKIGAKANL